MNTVPLACPVCGLSLFQDGSTLKCRARHTFDFSAKGYANLLTDPHRNSQSPGDNLEMVAARRRFLDSGAYRVLRNSLSEEVRRHESEIRVLVDAGCGEGAWTSGIREALPNPSVSIFGMDISKDAIRYASGRNRDIAWIVASLFHLPLKDGCADCLVNVFAPSCDPEFARILRKDGILMTVIPGRTHLWGLKCVLYEDPYENDEALPDLPDFILMDMKRITGFLHLAGRESLKDLLAMTPYFWRSPKAGIERLSELEALETPIEFLIATHRKR